MRNHFETAPALPDHRRQRLLIDARRPWWTPRAKRMLLLSLALAAWGMTDVRMRGRVDPNEVGIHKTDFTVYTEAGAAFFDGRDPYEVTNPRGWGYLYPPLFAILVSPLHALAPQNQVVVWFAISVLAAWGCYRECLKIANVVTRGTPFEAIPPWIVWATLAAVALPTLNCLQRGQVGLLQMFLLLWGFRLLVESRSALKSFAAGTVLALPIVLKVTPLVTVGYVLCEQCIAAWNAPRRSAALGRIGSCAGGTIVGLVGGLLIVPATLVGWQANLRHLDTWWTTVAVRAERSTDDALAGDSYSVRNQSLANAVCRLGNFAHYQLGGPNDEGLPPDAQGNRGLLMDHPAVGLVLLAARLLVTCLTVVVAWCVGRRRDPCGHAAFFGLACASTLVIAPIARGHYYVQLLPAVMFLGAWLLAQRRPRLAIAAVLVPCGLVLVHYALMNLAGRVGLLGIGTAVWFFTAAIAMIRIVPHESQEPARRMTTAPSRRRHIASTVSSA
jgi:hypothetical protein